MQPERIVLCHYRLEKAYSDLESSKVLLKEGFHTQSLNRSYYAIFHCTRVLLALTGFDSRKHSGIISYFNQHYVANGIFEKQYSKILMGAEKIRSQSDYDDFFIISREDADKQIENAELFLQRIKSHIDSTTQKNAGGRSRTDTS